MGSWLERERRTAKLIRACYNAYVGSKLASGGQLYALCKLTWITKGGETDCPDNTRSVVAPALSALVDADLTATTPTELSRELRDLGTDEEIVRLASHPLGFTNFYGGFRNVALSWLEAYVADVAPLVRRIARGRSNAVVREVYHEVEALPPLPRRRAGPLPASSLLTPLLACLEDRGRAPIINSRGAVRRRLRMLGLSTASLSRQCEGLAGLIGQAGLDDAFALDTSSDEQIRRAMRPVTPGPGGRAGVKPLAERRDEDVELLREADATTMRRIHNSMTNALRAVCAGARVSIEEGAERHCLFDALILHYAGTERHLLVEVKTDDSPPMCRMAVGQLQDYRRSIPHPRAAIDLAVLFPSKPSADARALLAYVGILALWFVDKMARIDGDVRIGATLQDGRRQN